MHDGAPNEPMIYHERGSWSLPALAVARSWVGLAPNLELKKHAGYAERQASYSSQQD